MGQNNNKVSNTIGTFTKPTGIKNVRPNISWHIILGKVETLRYGCKLEHNTSAKCLEIS